MIIQIWLKSSMNILRKRSWDSCQKRKNIISSKEVIIIHSFWKFNVPAQTISTFDFTNYPYYHHVDDEFSEMDVDIMEQLIEAIIPGITKMANTTEKEIHLTEK